MTRAKAIQAHCFGCSGDSYKEVTLCVIPDCPLYPYRFGDSPGSKGYKARMKLAKERWPDEYLEFVPSAKSVSKKTATLVGNDD
jgi:hypothetical protein